MSDILVSFKSIINKVPNDIKTCDKSIGQFIRDNKLLSIINCCFTYMV